MDAEPSAVPPRPDSPQGGGGPGGPEPTDRDPEPGRGAGGWLLGALCGVLAGAAAVAVG